MAIQTNILKHHATEIAAILGNKLIQLKRSASGALINSLTYDIKQDSEFAFRIKIMGNDYWRVVEYGVPTSNVPYNPNQRTGAANSKYIEGLMNWIRIKGIASDNKIIRAIAFQIARKQASSSRGGGGKGNPMDKNKLGFVQKTEGPRRDEVKKMAEAYKIEIVTLVNSLRGNIEITI